MRIAGNLFNLLVVVNCSVNFVLYSSFSSKFRMTFRRLFCRRARCCRRCLPPGDDAAERRWLRGDNDDDHHGGGGFEMTATKVGGRSVAVTVRSSPSLVYSGGEWRQRQRQRRNEPAVVVTTTSGGEGRSFVARQKSRDRKQLEPTPIIVTTSHCGLTATTTTLLLTSGSDQSIASETSALLVPNEQPSVLLESD